MGQSSISRFGVMKEFSDPTLVMCDYDTPILPPIHELWRVFHVLRITPEWMRFDRTAHGWHMVLKLPRKLPMLATVALQAILGSDPRRETLNLMRALTSPKGFAAERWNVLFERKIK